MALGEIRCEETFGLNFILEVLEPQEKEAGTKAGC